MARRLTATVLQRLRRALAGKADLRAADVQLLLDAFLRERFLDAEAWSERQQELLAPIPKSLQPGRLKKRDPIAGFGSVNAERVYAAAWRLEHMRQRSSGASLLEMLLVPEEAWRGGLMGPRYIPPISRRDAVVAACLIQWLGTNVGGAFVRSCEARIAKLQIEDAGRRAARLQREQADRERFEAAERRRGKGPKSRAISLG